MAEPFISEIRIFPYAFAPRLWAWCNGQILQISQNTALFALLGTQFGGDGRTTYGLPNLVDRTPIGAGRGQGLSDRRIGQRVGSATSTLTVRQLAAHTHELGAHGTPGAETTAPGHTFGGGPSARRGGGNTPVYAPANNLTPMASQAIANTGGGQAHANEQPYLRLNFCIALEGIFPSRN